MFGRGGVCVLGWLRHDAVAAAVPSAPSWTNLWTASRAECRKTHQLIAQPSFAVLSKGGSAPSLAKRDQTDVGISGALCPGVGFFGPLHAAPPDPPCGEVCPVASRDGADSFSMFCNEYAGGFRSALCTVRLFVRVGM